VAGQHGVEIPVMVRSLDQQTQAKNVFGVLWARAKIDALEDNFWDGTEVSETRDIIRDLGLQFSLVTPFTSFVAVDNQRVVGDGDPRTIVQPVERPEGVDVAMANGLQT
jgi:Ca-activated chloride channel family protein